jgi:glutathione synthase
LVERAILYALSHGLLFPHPTTAQTRVPAAAIHVPFALFPALFPRRLFQHAQKLQRMYNILYARIAMDEEFLDCVMGELEGVGKVDRFVGRLWRIWKDLRCEGLAQV